MVSSRYKAPRDKLVSLSLSLYLSLSLCAGASGNASGFGLGMQACLLGSIDMGEAGQPNPHLSALGTSDQLFNISRNGTLRNRGAAGSPGSCLGLSLSLFLSLCQPDCLSLSLSLSASRTVSLSLSLPLSISFSPPHACASNCVYRCGCGGRQAGRAWLWAL